jgi:Spy/CpxP family protein refolding chaperone
MTLCSIAIAVGAVALFGVLKRVIFHRRYGRFAGGCGPGFGGHGCHGEGQDGTRWSRRWGGPGRSFWLRGIFSRLDTTPGQEREIRAAIEELQTTARTAAGGLRNARGDLARAIGGEVFDEVAASEASTRADATSTAIKDAVASALRRIHAVLDPTQRARLAELLEKGPGFGRRWGNPYRDAAH